MRSTATHRKELFPLAEAVAPEFYAQQPRATRGLPIKAIQAKPSEHFTTCDGTTRPISLASQELRSARALNARGQSRFAFRTSAAGPGRGRGTTDLHLPRRVAQSGGTGGGPGGFPRVPAAFTDAGELQAPFPILGDPQTGSTKAFRGSDARLHLGEGRIRK